MEEPQHSYGLTLPHFGTHATRERLITGAQAAEAHGFDSVWVRDHVVYRPHRHEDQDRKFLDPLIALSTLAGATSKLRLGTASLIPHRHPIHLAGALASLEFLAGAGRVIAGVGTGHFNHEFEAVGLGHHDRRALLREQVQIIRDLWTGQQVTHEGVAYEFEEVEVHPSPVAIPIWYCGYSPAAVRRAVEYADGWLPGRIPLKSYAKRMELLRELANAAGKPIPVAGASPIVSLGRTREEALGLVNWQGMLAQAEKNPTWEVPDSGSWTRADDLDGALIYGTPDDIVAAVKRYQELGLSHIIFDLRHQFEDWEECVSVIGSDVLPRLRVAS